MAAKYWNLDHPQELAPSRRVHHSWIHRNLLDSRNHCLVLASGSMGVWALGGCPYHLYPLEADLAYSGSCDVLAWIRPQQYVSNKHSKVYVGYADYRVRLAIFVAAFGILIPASSASSSSNPSPRRSFCSSDHSSG